MQLSTNDLEGIHNGEEFVIQKEMIINTSTTDKDSEGIDGKLENICRQDIIGIHSGCLIFRDK